MALREPGWDINDEMLRSLNAYPTDSAGRDWTEIDYDVTTSSVAGNASVWDRNLAGPFDCNAPNCAGTVNALTAPKTNVHVPMDVETSFLARKTFTLTAQQAAAATGTISFICDSGCAFYINGVEAGRSVMPAGALTPNTFASGGGDEDAPFLTMAVTFGGAGQPALVAGTNVFAVETHNNDTSSTDIGFGATLDIVGGPASVAANDTTTGAATYTVTTQPTNGTVTMQANGNFEYTPNANYAGPDSFVYRVTDSGPAATATVSLTINSVNDRPVTQPDTYFGVEGGAISITSPTATPFSILPAGSNWFYSDDGGDQNTLNPEWKGAPAAGFNPAGGGETGWRATSAPAEFGYGDGGEVTLLNCGPSAPACNANNFITSYFWRTFDIAGAIPPQMRVGLVRDDGGVVYINGVEVFRSNMPAGTITYTTPSGGTIVSETAFQETTISTSNLNLLPTGNTISVEVHQASATSSDVSFDLRLEGITPAGVLNNDTDPEGTALTAVLLDSSELTGAGTLTFNPNGTFTFDADPGVSGILSFTYAASDGTDQTPQTVTMTFSAIDTSPYSAVADSFNASEDTPLTVTGNRIVGSPNGGLLANDVHPGDERDLINISITTQPTNGTVTLTGSTGGFVYTPNLNFSGTDTFQYQVSDGFPANPPSTATVTIEVASVPDVPTAVNDTYFGVEGGTISVNVPIAPPFTMVPLQSTGWEVNDELLIADNQYPTDAGGRVWNARDYDISTSRIGATPSVWDPNLTAGFQSGPVAGLTNPTTVDVPAATETTFLARKTFTLTADQATVPSGTIRYLCDSGCVFYINGVEAGYSPNMEPTDTPPGPRPLTPNAFSDDAGNEDTFADLAINFAGLGIPLFAGNNVFAVEIHNDNLTSTDIGFDAQLVGVPVAGVLNNDSDVEGNAMTAAIANTDNLTGLGQLFFNADGTFTFDANSGVSGLLTFTYTANDATGPSAPATVTLNIAALDSNPYTAVSDNYNATEDTVLTVTGNRIAGSPQGGLMANDTHPGDESDSVTFSITIQPTSGTVALTGNTGGFVYTPAANFAGVVTFEYQVNDGFNPPSRATVTINVAGTPDMPTAVNDSYVGREGQTLTVTVPTAAAISIFPAASNWSYIDDGTDQDALNPSWKAGPSAAFDPATAGWKGPAPGDFGYGDDDETTVVDCGPAAGNECTAANNPGGKYITTYFWRTFDIAGSIPAALRFGLSVDDGAVIYINGVEVFQSANLADPVNYLTETGGAGDDATPFVDTLVSTAGLNLQATGNTIAVEVHQDAPTSSDVTFDLRLEGVPLAGVLNNDTDPDGGALTAAVATPPTGGNLTLNPNGTFTFVPNAGTSGNQTFTYTASNGGLTSTPATVTIMLSPVDSGPFTAVADTFAASEDTELTVTGNSIAGSPQGGLLANDQHPGDQQDPVTITVLTQPANGTVTLTGNTGGFVYTPDDDFAGADSFVYQVDDGFGSISSAMATINVSSVDDAPIGTPDTYDVAGTFTVPATASHLGRRSQWEYLDAVLNGMQDDPMVGTQPDPYPTDALGNQWYEEDFDTTTGGTANGNWNFGQGVFAAPLLEVNPIGTTLLNGIDGSYNQAANSVNTYLFRTTFTLPNGSSLTELGMNILADDGVIVYINGVEVLRQNMPAAPAPITTTTDALGAGSEDAYVRHNNVAIPAGVLRVGSNTVAVELHQVNDTSSDVGFDMEITNPGPVSVLSNDSDRESDPMTATILPTDTQPQHGSVVMNPNGTFTYTPAAGYTGPDTFQYRANGAAQSAPVLVTLNITSTSTCTFDADLDNDNDVDRADLRFLMGNYGMASATAAQGDINCDGRVGVRDLIELRNAIGSDPPGPSPAAPGALVANANGNAVDRVLAGLDRAVDAIGDRAPRATARLSEIRDRISQTADNASDSASEARDAARRVIRATRGRLAAHARAIGDLFDRNA